MKIKEFIVVPKNLKDTTSCGTTSCGQPTGSAQDIVSHNIVPKNNLALEVDSPIEEHSDHSAISEGVSQIFRRKKGGAPTKGFRCTSGPRKGRIVAKPSTCFQKTDPQRSAKIRKKRSIKAKIAGKKLGITKRSRAGSRRLKGVQIKKRKGTQPIHGKSSRSGSRPLQKSRTVKPK
jgi:hypothetical protein|tara:strand:+ start:144 stop:671 length:528 start_codon:yes stop_codon:yes gene_type:complete